MADEYILAGNGLYLPRSVAPIALPRADASYNSPASQVPYDLGSLANSLSGLGTVNDKGAAARPNLYRLPLTDAELAVLYRYTARRLVEIVPNDCTRKGWQVEEPDTIGNPFEAAEERLQIPIRYRLAHIWARVFGGSRVWMIVHEEGSPSLSEPLDPSRVTAVKNLVVLTRDEYSPITYNTDPEDDNYRLPELYSVSPSVGGVGGERVHHTRLLRFSGGDLTATQIRANRGDGESWLESCWEALRHDQQIGAAGAHIVQELSVFWIKLAAAAQRQTGGARTSLLDRLAAVNVSKSVANAILLQSDEEVGEVARNLSGFKDVSDDAERRLARVTGYPLAVLSGESPSGLNTDGESHRKIWQNIIASEQARHYRAPLRFLYRCLWYAEYGAEPESWSVVFNKLDELTEQAQADLEDTHANTDAVRIESGVITSKEARSRFAESGYQNSITIDQDAEVEPTPEEDPTGPGGSDEPQEDARRRADSAARIPEEMRRKRYKIPAGAKAAVRRYRRWQRKYGSEVKGMTAAGKRRARQLERDPDISLGDLIEIDGWHDRHRGNEKVPPELKDTPWRDAGYISYLGWGAAAMRGLAARAVQAALNALDRKQDRARGSEKLIFLVPLPESAERSRLAALEQVRALLPELVAPTHEPHVTLLYVGDVHASRLVDVSRAAGEVLAAAAPLSLQGGRVSHFEPSPSSDGRTPIIIEYRSRGLSALNAELLRALAVDIATPQFASYRPHITLGYLPRALTDSEMDALGEITAPGRWMVEEIELRASDRVLGTPYRLTRNDAADPTGYHSDASPGSKSAEPAPPSDRIKGSGKNPSGSASGSRGGITIAAAQEKVLRGYLEELPEDKREGIDLGVLKAVYRRGAGAYSTSHDPSMGRVQWSLARVKAFLKLVRSGEPDNPKYTGDYDLLPDWHPKKPE